MAGGRHITAAAGAIRTMGGALVAGLTLGALSYPYYGYGA
jgi:hypothetical protein